MNGDTKDCSNYRRLTLLKSGLKIYEEILNDRGKYRIGNTLHEVQSDFKKRRITQDHMFTMKEITDKMRLKGKRSIFGFIDV